MVQRLKILRVMKGYTQQRLSEVSGVPRICIARYESGEYTPSIKNGKLLAAALGCTIDELVGDSDAVPND